MTGIPPEIRLSSAGFRRNTKKFRRKIFPESGGFPGEFYRIPPEFRRSCHVRFLAGKSFFKGEKSIWNFPAKFRPNSAGILVKKFNIPPKSGKIPPDSGKNPPYSAGIPTLKKKFNQKFFFLLLTTSFGAKFYVEFKFIIRFFIRV